MKVLIIAKKILKQNMSRPLNLLCFIILPIVFMLILGTALSGVFSSQEELPALKLAYCYKGTGIFSGAFSDFIRNIPAVESRRLENENAGLILLKEGDFQSLAVLNEADNKINLYFNNTSGIAAGIIQGLIQGFINEFNFMHVVIKQAPQGNKVLLKAAPKDFTYLQALDKPKKPGAMDSMGIFLMTMFILYGAFLASYTIEDERNRLTYHRILISPASKTTFILGVFLGNFINILIQALTVFLLAKYVLGIYYGDNTPMVLTVLSAEVFLATAIGVSMGFILKDPKTVKGIANPLIIFFVYVSGAYGPVPDNLFFNIAAQVSPVSWVKNALFEIIYSNSLNYFLPALLICLISGLVLMLMASAALMGRKEI